MITVVNVSELNSESRREGPLAVRGLSPVELRWTACGMRRSCARARFVMERRNGRKEGTEQAQIIVYVSMLEKGQL